MGAPLRDAIGVKVKTAAATLRPSSASRLKVEHAFRFEIPKHISPHMT